MTLRNRTLVAAAGLVLAPLLVLAIAIRREMSVRLTDQYASRVDALVAVIETELADRSRDLRARLVEWKTALRDDDRFRLAVEGRDDPGNYLLDAAGRAMGLMGLDFLQIQDADGRILSSGHHRNEYDRVERELVDWLAATPDEAGLVRARRPTGPFFALVRLDSLALGAHRLYLTAGWELDHRTLSALSPHPDLVVSLVHPQGIVSSREAFARRLRPPGDAPGVLDELAGAGTHMVRGRPLAVPPGAGGEAMLVVSHSLEERRAILGALDRRLVAAVALVAVGSIALAVRVSRRITEPIEDLARRTETVDLDRLDVRYPTDRSDEIGTLARFLAAMTRRLKTSVMRLREAERRAAFADLARQVNHDLRNGVTPIRNVVRHLSEVARDTPGELARVFRERETTLRSGLGYLEDLAGNYARLSSDRESGACDLGEIARHVADALGDGRVTVTVASGVPPARADAVGARRIVENLVSNARDCVAGNGRIDVKVEPGTLDEKEGAVKLTVADDGPGLPDPDRVFEHFWTTKETGTGLGLSIVKRIVSDHEGTITVDSQPGAGTTFVVTLPAAPGARA